MPKREKITITQEDIDEGVCRKSRRCPIRLGVKRSLDLGHGYCHVDATGIAITRNGTNREKSFICRTALVWLKNYDDNGKDAAKPFHFWAEFFPIRKVHKLSAAKRAEYTARAIKNGNSKKKYNDRSRLVGVSFAKKAA